MAYLGLVPSEHSSGSTRRQGGITEAGTGVARRMLIEATWSYRFPARPSREQLLRREHLAKPMRDIVWKAQERLCRHHRKMARDGILPTVIMAAIARELAGFVWAIAQQVRFGARQTSKATENNWKERRYNDRRGRPILGKAGGTVTVRRTLASTISRIPSDAGLDRRRSETNHRSGGNRSAHQNLINHCFMIVPPALPSGSHAERLEQTGEDFSRLLLETANMRVVRSRIGDQNRPSSDRQARSWRIGLWHRHTGE
jgi:hypothetical protein